MNELVTLELPGGFVVCGDSTSRDACVFVQERCGAVPLVVVDPPYGNIVQRKWDKRAAGPSHGEWMLHWTSYWAQHMLPGAAMYVWGGIGKPQDRPFFHYLSLVESMTSLQMAMLVTWSKKRAYGVRNNYLMTREECAYLVNGDAKKPRVFHVPYLDAKRGYSGYNKDYPALDERYRRTAVWTDVTEIMRGKLHECHKPGKLFQIMIETHTDSGEWVIDLFGGSGECAVQAARLGRKFVVFEQDPDECAKIAMRLAPLDTKHGV